MGQDDRSRKEPSLWQKIKEVLFGLFVYDLYRSAIQAKAEYEDALNVLLMGQFLGIPLMNSVFTLRLFPYLLPQLGDWKR
ncbi:MAG: hypothetical protein ACE5LG_10520, partial [Anaerolineae bacterium]